MSPKIYKEAYLRTQSAEKLRPLVLAWQEAYTELEQSKSVETPAPVLPEIPLEPVVVVLTPPVKNEHELKDKIHNLIDTWAGKLIGRKIGNLQPGPPGPLEQVVENILKVFKDE